MTVTKARKKLLAWMLADPKARTRTAIAKHLGVSQPAVTAWTRGSSRPEPHLRQALETLSSGEVPAEDWTLAEEAKAVARVRPLTGTEG